MGYTYKDADEKYTLGPSITGLREMKELMQEWPANHPALDHLIENGYSTKLTALSFECRNLAKKTIDANIKHTLLHLAATVSKANEILILEH